MRASKTPLLLIPLLTVILLIPGVGMADDLSSCPDGIAFNLPGGGVGCSHGDDPAPPPLPEQYARQLQTVASAADGQVACTDDGTSGRRVQVLYVVAEDQIDESASTVSQIRGWAAEIDDLVARSAQAGGADLAVRWVHDQGCVLDVETVVVPANADDDFGTTIEVLGDLGYANPDRHYLAFVDATQYCGLAVNYLDDRPTQDNFNNGGNSLYARVDRDCFGSTVAMHELTHMLGGVQPSAPNSTPFGHCTDEWDIMCYPDGPGVTMDIVCEDQGLDVLLDCGHDDYFNPAPAEGSYLDTHWNVARSGFLTAPDDRPIASSEPAVPTGKFIDVPTENAFVSDIGWLAESGITLGCNPPANDHFCPDDTVTRSQMAAFLNRAIEGPLPVGDGFLDTNGTVFEDDVRRLAGAGITHGCATDLFCPDAAVTRGQMAAFLVRAFQLPEEGDDRFGDDDGHIFEADIERLAAAGITSGCSSDSYCPDAPVTRAQMAAFLRRALTG